MGVHGSDGGMGEKEGSTRGETGGPDTTDDGDGGPDDELDGEVSGLDKRGLDGVEGGQKGSRKMETEVRNRMGRMTRMEREKIWGTEGRSVGGVGKDL